jgi:hypothetical protein
MNTYAARTRRGEKCFNSHSSRSFASNSLTWWKLLALPSHCLAYPRNSSDIWEQVEVLIVFILAALTEAHGLLRLDEFNPLNPLHHLVAKLIFDA